MNLIQIKDNIFHPVYNSKFILAVLQPLLHPPTKLTIKRPSPDWNVRNADVSALDKLIVTSIVLGLCKETETEILDQGEAEASNLPISWLRGKVNN